MSIWNEFIVFNFIKCRFHSIVYHYALVNALIKKIEAKAKQLTSLWKDPEKYIDLVINWYLIRVFYKGHFYWNTVAIHWNAFCLVKNCCNNLTYPASKVGCYATAWLIFVYWYSERASTYFIIFGSVNEMLFRLALTLTIK